MCEHVDAAWDQVVLAVDSKLSDLDGERVDLMNAEHVGRKTTCCQWLRWNYKNQKKTHKLEKYAHNHNTSDSTVLGSTHTGTSSGNHTGTVGGTANSTIVNGATRANTVINSDNRFTGDFFLDDVHITAFNSKSAFERALAGFDSSGNVNRPVPAAQITNAMADSLTASPLASANWVTIDGASYSPTQLTQDITVTYYNGVSNEQCVIRWTMVNVANSNNDYISACTEQTDSGNNFTLGSITDLSGNDKKYATCVVTHDASSATITLQALLSLTHVSGGGK